MAISLLGIKMPVLPVVAGCVGCGAQLFVYSFAANLSYIKDIFFKCLLIVISTMTIGLSMFIAYSTLISFLETKSKTMAHSEFASTQKQKIIESRSSDMNINSLSAEQAISDKYRTQSKELTESNEALRAQQLEELSKLTTETRHAASPLDGLVRVVGYDGFVSALFCAWLAITFDLLPILGMSLLGRLAVDRAAKSEQEHLSDGRTKNHDVHAFSLKNEKQPGELMRERVDPVENDLKVESLTFKKTNGIPLKSVETLQARTQSIVVSPSGGTNREPKTKASKPQTARSMDETTQEQDAEPPNRVIQDILDKKPIYSDLDVEYQKTPVGDVPTEVLYPIITKYLSEEAIPLSYAGVGEFTGLSKWKVQQYFTKAVEEGFLVNKTQENVDAGYEFSKTVRYHIKRDIDLEAVLDECQQW